MLKNLRNLLAYTPKVLVPILAVAAAFAIPAAIYAWGPGRPAFTMAHPASYVTFDSITDNPNYGDEREFMTVKDLTAGGALTDTAKLQPGHEYQFQVYIHNNAASNLNASGKGVAKDTKVRVALPSAANGSSPVNGFISASNAIPTEVYDNATLTSSGTMPLQYEAGSAMLHTHSQQVALSDNLVTTGVMVGDSDLSGVWHGCIEFAGAVTFKAKVPESKPVTPTETTSLSFQKRVSKHGANQWTKNYAAQPGETVDFLLEYKNTGTSVQNNVTFSDQLPSTMQYVTGSSRLGNAEHPNGVATSDDITTNGLNAGSYAGGGNAWVIFSATVPAESKLACGANMFTNRAKVVGGTTTGSDSATISAQRTCVTPAATPQPKLSCNGLTVTSVSATKFNFVASKTVENATFNKFLYVVKDSNGKVLSTLESTSDDAVSYENATAGTYTVTASVVATANGQQQTASNSSCEKSFTVAATSTPSLPETGPAEAAASSIVGSGALGYGVHIFARSRRNLRSAFKK